MMSRTSSPPRGGLAATISAEMPAQEAESRATISADPPVKSQPQSGLPAKILAGAISNLEQKVTVRNLNFYYGDSLALKNVSLPLCAKKVTAFIGPSGCGKSISAARVKPYVRSLS